MYLTGFKIIQRLNLEEFHVYNFLYFISVSCNRFLVAAHLKKVTKILRHTSIKHVKNLFNLNIKNTLLCLFFWYDCSTLGLMFERAKRRSFMKTSIYLQHFLIFYISFIFILTRRKRRSRYNLGNRQTSIPT